MPDITTSWNPVTLMADWQMAGADLAQGTDLITAAYISLFTDRLAQPSDVIPDGTNDPRGWVGDLGAAYPIGSRLWLLTRAKATQDTLNNAYDYIQEALQWMLDDGVVARIDIDVEWITPRMLGAQVTFWQQDGTSIAQNYSWAWAELS